MTTLQALAKKKIVGRKKQSHLLSFYLFFFVDAPAGYYLHVLLQMIQMSRPIL